jgi:large subunit ribosomal protein L4
MELEVLKINGENAGRKVSLDEAIFGVTPNDHAIYLDVKHIRARGRQGTHKSKERNEITGSTKKLKRQKGTGTARMGSIKSPLLRGGGRAFGPQPRDYSFKLNKKVKRLARKSALTYKAKDNNIMVIEDFTFDQPKTKNYVKMLEDLKVADTKTLVVYNELDGNVHLASRNVQGAMIQRATKLNTYEVLNANKLIICESAIKTIEEILK